MLTNNFILYVTIIILITILFVNKENKICKDVLKTHPASW